MTGVRGECTVVVPTIGRPSLDVLLDALATGTGPRPAELILVDDRPTGAPLAPERPGLPPVRVVRTGGGGPAVARNLGWRTARTPWIAFLDDDVVPDTDWCERLPAPPPAAPAAAAARRGSPSSTTTWSPTPIGASGSPPTSRRSPPTWPAVRAGCGCRCGR